MRLIDTDVLIDHFHGIEAATAYIANALLADGELFISVVSVAEVLAGMRPEEEADTEELFRLTELEGRVRLLPTRDEFFSRTDELLTELRTLREEYLTLSRRVSRLEEVHPGGQHP